MRSGAADLTAFLPCALKEDIRLRSRALARYCVDAFIRLLRSQCFSRIGRFTKGRHGAFRMTHQRSHVNVARSAGRSLPVAVANWVYLYGYYV